jgi:predicted ATPase
MADLPAGTVTLLFTDIEGSTRLLRELGDGYAQVLAEHRRLLREAFVAHGGVEVDTQGDSFFVAFPRADGALAAAQAGQLALQGGRVLVRMGMHTGEPELVGGEYVGYDVHLAARVMSAGHGGQVLVSATTARLVDGVALRDLGEHRLKDIERPVALFQLGEESFPPLKTIANTNLPRPVSSFVGRERDLAAVRGRLRDGARLVTLTGPGGSGKTRLALEVAAEVVPEVKAGVFWVGLAALRDPSLVMDAVAQTLGAKGGLSEHIGERDLLLVLDNLEQVIEAASELAELLESCPNLRLLVTSRELLRVRGETEYPVAPLEEADAVRLFCTRSGLEATAEIAELCRRLDNLPLAVELAAARTRLLSPAQVLERLSRRLDLLKGGRDVDPRQQTLRATIEWSYDLLEQSEQATFVRLGVFAGGFELEAAEAVVGADVDVLQSLVEKQLLRRWPSGRLGMLETIREFARERLSASADTSVERRHAVYYTELAETAERHYFGAEQPIWLDRLRVEIPNLRAVLRTGDDAAVTRVAAALPFCWYSLGQWREARQSLEAAHVRLDGAPAEVRAKVLGGLAVYRSFDGDLDEAVALSHESVELARAAEDAGVLGQALIMQQLVLSASGRDEEMGQAAQDAITSARASGDRFLLAISLNNLADLELRRERYAEAKTLLDESVELAETLGDRFNEAGIRAGRASALIQIGQPDTARAEFALVLQAALELGAIEHVVVALEGLAAVAAETGQDDEAPRLFGAAHAYARAHDLDYDRQGFERMRRNRAIAALRGTLGGERFDELFAEGEKTTPEHALAKDVTAPRLP